MTPSLADDILESLDLSRAEPGIGLLEALFARFNARVPFESASKILRDAEIADAAAKPRLPEVFWADHLALGTGGTCFARVAAFDALLRGLGYSTRRVLGRVERDGDHAALLIGGPQGEVIADVGFPLPALLPAREGSVETALAEVRVAATPRGFAVRMSGGVPEGPRAIEIFDADVGEPEFLAAWHETFRPKSRFLQRVVLRRDLGDRAIRYAGGEVAVDDRHSRLRVPLPPPRDAALSELFGIDAETLRRAFARAPDTRPPRAFATLTAYLETNASAADAFSRIATASGYARLLEGVGGKAESEEAGEGFRVRLSPPGAGDADGSSAAIEDEVTVDAAARRIAVSRRSGSTIFRSAYAAEERDGDTFLLREAALTGAREDLLRNDSLRGRLAAGLAVDLLAWARAL